MANSKLRQMLRRLDQLTERRREGQLTPKKRAEILKLQIEFETLENWPIEKALDHYTNILPLHICRVCGAAFSCGHRQCTMPEESVCTPCREEIAKETQ